MAKETYFRIFGNLLLIIGYCIILYGDFTFGLTIKFLGGVLVIPSLIKIKMWDGVALTSFFSFIEMGRLFQLYVQSQ
jgi:hypothetical protein